MFVWVDGGRDRDHTQRWPSCTFLGRHVATGIAATAFPFAVSKACIDLVRCIEWMVAPHDGRVYRAGGQSGAQGSPLAPGVRRQRAKEALFEAAICSGTDDEDARAGPLWREDIGASNVLRGKVGGIRAALLSPCGDRGRPRWSSDLRGEQSTGTSRVGRW
jgi:hypothetical protein